jgi:hypothetical protein
VRGHEGSRRHARGVGGHRRARLPRLLVGRSARAQGP